MILLKNIEFLTNFCFRVPVFTVYGIILPQNIPDRVAREATFSKKGDFFKNKKRFFKSKANAAGEAKSARPAAGFSYSAKGSSAL